MPSSELQTNVYRLVTPPASITGASSTNVQLDAAGASEIEFVFTFGALGAAGITALSIHASDTSGFTPGAGNLISSFTGSDLPADANDNTIWTASVSAPAVRGRYWNVIITAGANACLVGCVAVIKQSTSPSSATEKGAVRWSVVA